jgi:WD40 repeat protein
MDDTHLASVGYEGRAFFWDVDGSANKAEELVWPGGTKKAPKSLHAVAFAPDGRLAIGGFKSVDVWDSVSGSWPLRSAQHNLITSVGWSSSGRLLAAGPSGKVSIFSDHLVEAGSYVHPLFRQILAAVWLDSEQLAVGADDNITIFDYNEREKETAQVVRLFGGAGAPRKLASDGVGRVFAQIGDDQFVRLWSPSSKRSTPTLASHQASISALRWSVDGRAVMSGATDGRLVVWDPSNPADEGTILGSPVSPVTDALMVSSDPGIVLGIGGLVRSDQREKSSGHTEA